MDNIPFKTRVRNEIVSNAILYKEYFLEYDYLIYSEKFVNSKYYIVSASKDNYRHLTGVQTELSGNDFFDKCLDGSITEDDFSFKKKYQDEKTVKGSVRRKINMLPLIKDLFSSDIRIEEDFVKNSIRCSFATGNQQCTVGFIVAGKARPMTLLKGNELDDEKAVGIGCILRKSRKSDMFSEIVVGNKQSIEKLAAMCESVAVDTSSLMDDQDYKFFTETCESFIADQIFEEYKEYIHRWLMLSDWHYTAEHASEIIAERIGVIEEAYSKKIPVADVGAEIGFIGG